MVLWWQMLFSRGRNHCVGLGLMKNEIKRDSETCDPEGYLCVQSDAAGSIAMEHATPSFTISTIETACQRNYPLSAQGLINRSDV